jgi:hypothetical protein
MMPNVTNHLLTLSASTGGLSSGIVRVATSCMKCLASLFRNEQTIFSESSLKAPPNSPRDREFEAVLQACWGLSIGKFAATLRAGNTILCFWPALKPKIHSLISGRYYQILHHKLN